MTLTPDTTLEEAIDRALDVHIQKWYLYNEQTHSTTIVQSQLVQIAAQAAVDFFDEAVALAMSQLKEEKHGEEAAEA